MQTSIEWLYNELFTKKLDGFSESEWDIIDKAFEQAKEMHKQEIETLYTEEQVRELLYYYDLEIKKHLLNYTIEHSLHSKMCDGINDVRNTYIQSLKQPKQ